MKKIPNLKKYKTFSHALVLLCVIAVLGACSSRVMDLTLASTKGDIDVSKLGELKRGERVTGEYGFLSKVLFFPTPRSRNFDYEDAIANALDNAPGAVALVDVVIYEKTIKVPFVILSGLFRYTTYIAEGTPLIDPKLAEKAQNKPGYSAIEPNEAGKDEDASLKELKRIPTYVKR